MYENQNLVFGRGRLYFDQFAPGTTTGKGERYLGNSPSVAVQVAREIEVITSSIDGVLVRTGSEIISENANSSFTVDHISPENLMLWFGAVDSGRTASAGGVASNIVAYPGSFYQVGASQANPMGRRNLTSVTLQRGATVIDPLNYETDLENGRIRIAVDAAITPGETLTLSGVATETAEKVLVSGKAVVTGSLRFVSDALHGKGQDYFFPWVELKPSGDFQLKGTTWQELRFDVSARKRRRYDLYYVATRG